MVPPATPGGAYTAMPIFQAPSRAGTYELANPALLSTGKLVVPADASVTGLTPPEAGATAWTAVQTQIGLHKNTNDGGIGTLIAGPNGVAYGTTYGTASIIFSYTP